MCIFKFFRTTTEEDVKAIYPEETYQQVVEVKKNMIRRSYLG